MALACSDAMLRPDSASVSRAPSEIDLYPELCDFLDLSPEERKGQPHPPDSQRPPGFTESVKGESDPTPATTREAQLGRTTDRAFQVLDTSADEGNPAPEARSHSLVTQGPQLNGMSPLEMLEPFAIEDESAGFGSGTETGVARGVCLTCSAESEPDDLFCASCGAFLDEVALASCLNRTCMSCGKDVFADEIFCPWCGSSLSAV